MAEIPAPSGASGAMTQEEFRALPEGPPDFEFEYGALIPMPRPHSRHQDIVTALARVLPVYVARHGRGRCWVEIDVELNDRLTYVPDLVEEYHAAGGHYVRTSAAEAGQAFRPEAFADLEFDVQALLVEQGAMS